jgi:hypothetical protein
MNEPKYVAQTLAWCNRKRKAKNKPPLKKLPKGRRNDPMSCPCGKATGLSVGIYHYAYPGEMFSDCFPLPKSVESFVLAFDGGYLPQYEDK